jgi:hypothetical protein
VDQDARALDMAQEIVTQAHSHMGAFDQAGDVGQNQAFLFIQVCHAQVGLQGSERVRGDLGFGVGDDREQGGFTGVRDTDDTDIGDELELQAQDQRLAGFAALANARGLVGGGGKAGIAAPTTPAFGDHQPLAWLDQIAQ